MNKRIKKFCIFFAAMNLVPLAAMGDEAATAAAANAANDPHELSVSEALSTFRNFDPDFTNSTHTSVSLYGKIFNECKGHFEISNTLTDSSVVGAGFIGFKITDKTGRGMKCMDERKARSCSANTCSDLYQLPGGSLDLAKFTSQDAKVGLIHVDPNVSRANTFAEEFPQKLEVVSTATLRRKREEARIARRNNLIATYKAQVANCRKSEEDLPIAKAAYEALVSMKALADDEERRTGRDIALAELTLLSKKVAKSSVEDLDELKSQLADWAGEHPEHADRVVTVLNDIATRYAKSDTEDGFAKAKETLQDARGLNGISERAAGKLDNLLKFDLPVQEQTKLAMNGWQNNFMLWNTWPKTFQEMQQLTWNACQAQQGGSLEACSNAMTASRAVAQIPRQAQAVDQQRAQFQMQLQQAFSQAMGQGSPNGTQNGVPTAPGIGMSTQMPSAMMPTMNGPQQPPYQTLPLNSGQQPPAFASYPQR